jgi:ABC-type Co2+ transport system permease subunit
MHGMLSAAILMGVFAVAAAACLYAVVRVSLAGTRRGPDAGLERAGQVHAGQVHVGQVHVGQVHVGQRQEGL